MEQKELKSCPFCGGEAIVLPRETIQNETAFAVMCSNLDCLMCAGGTLRQTKEQAIEAWNRRAE